MQTRLAQINWRGWGCAALAGVCWSAAFPKPGVAGLAWVVPGLIWVTTRVWKAPFRSGFVAGLVFALSALHWLLFIPVKFLPVVGWLALSLYVALYPAAWAWFSAKLAAVLGSHTNFASAQPWASTGGTWVQRQCLWIVCAAAWVAMEMILARLFSGFPWNLLGVSQAMLLPLIQVTAFTGIYGVSFLVVWFSLAVTNGLLALVRPQAHLRQLLCEIVLPSLAVLVVYAWGFWRIQQPVPAARTIKVAAVQPSIPQTMIWNPQESSARFTQLLELSRLALATKPDLLLWPEAAVPKLLRYDREIYEAVTNLVRQQRVWLILGVDDAEPRGEKVDYYNSSFLVSPRGQLVANYRKRRLVIFGEYIPLAEYLPFMKYFTPIEGGFARGTGPVPFEIPDLDLTASVLICFEDIFPHFTREYAGPAVDLLVNLTNNGWFGESAAQWQHAYLGLFRAVENGLPLVRCANNGLTCWVDPHGRMHEVYFGNSTDIYGAGFKTFAVPLAAPNTRATTFYSRNGDVFGWACVVLTGGLILLQRLSRPRHPGAPGQK